MSFIKRAQEAAAQAAEAARVTATAANQKANDPATQEAMARSARDAMGVARRGVTTVVEKIDPGTLAELIVKATSLQELTNKALRQKGSMYRIGEISISASIPPAVSFAISRLGDAEEAVGNAMSSVDLIKQEVHDGELVLALDGTTVDDAAIQGERMPAEIPTDLPASQDPGAAPLPLEPSADETSADEAPSGWVLPR